MKKEEAKERSGYVCEKFRKLLQKELLRRIHANPRYSQRSFATYLKIDPGSLSQVLRGQRKLPVVRQKAILSRLQLEAAEIQELTEMVPDVDQVRQLTVDTFSVIADWYHYAILELTRISGFRGEPTWISSALGISLPEANAAIERLKRLEFLEISSTGKWRDTSGFLTTVGNDFTATAFQRLQKQLLTKAMTSLENDDYEIRDFSSLTFAIDASRFPEFKKKIKKFRREMNNFAEDQKKSGVYNLSISFYPLMKDRNKKD